MTARKPVIPVRLGFEETSQSIQISAILPLREVSEAVRKTVKYLQIAASIAEVGIIEPPVVTRDADNRDEYHLLDGHLRVDIIRARGETEVVCLVATDDEAYTYNKRVSRIATIQEHRMILAAIRKGVSEERLARALDVNISNIRAKRNLLVGICPEVAELFRDRHVPINVFTELRWLRPLRQIDAAQAMIAMNRFSVTYAKSIVASSSADELVEGKRAPTRGLTADQISVMQREADNLDREVNLIKQSYSEDHLDLMLALGYLEKLLGNARAVRHLAQHHPDLLAEFQKLTKLDQAA